jgi:hypothetical protein
LHGKFEQEIFYNELLEPIGPRRADFVVEGKVLVELKAIILLEDVRLGPGFKLFESIQIGRWHFDQLRRYKPHL